MIRHFIKDVFDAVHDQLAPIIAGAVTAALITLWQECVFGWRSLARWMKRRYHKLVSGIFKHRPQGVSQMAFDIQARAKMGGADGTDDQLIVISAILDSLVGNLVAAAPVATGGFNGCTAHLFKNTFDVDENTLKTDLTEATFPGYAASAALVFSSAGIDDAGNHIVVADVPAAWHCTGDPVGEVVHGLYLLGSGAAPLLCGVSFATPIAISLDQVIPATIILQVGNNT